MVFNNEALLRILGVKSTKDLHGILMKPLFLHREHSTALSLLSTVSSRYSNALLSQEYKYQRNNDIPNQQQIDKNLENSINRDDKSERIICF